MKRSFIAHWVLLFCILLLGGCSSSSDSDSIRVEDLNLVQQFDEVESSQVDTVWIVSRAVDDLMNYEHGVDTYNKLKECNIKKRTRTVENAHTDEVDQAVTFSTEGAECSFLEVTNLKRTFMIHCSGTWSDNVIAEISSIRNIIEELINTAHYEDVDASVVCYTNAEEQAQIFITFDEGKIKKYEYINWLD